MASEMTTSGLSYDDQRRLRALLYMLTPVEMLEVVMEVIRRQRDNAPRKRRKNA